jgi:hypothetical protein
MVAGPGMIEKTADWGNLASPTPVSSADQPMKID